MRVGAAQVDITPEPGIDLTGFLARTNPSTSVLDPLYVKALYIEQNETRVLWMHADLLGFDREFVSRFLNWAWEKGIVPPNVIVSATHTHSGPPSMEILNCARLDDGYRHVLMERMQSAALQAMEGAEPASMVTATGALNLAIDRRKKPSAYVDPRIAGVAWRRADGSYITAMLNYAMHPVALGSNNRAISADWCGYTAQHASRELEGAVVLVANGAAGNINPPFENVSPQQLREWGESVSSAIVPQLRSASPADQTVRIASNVIDMPLEALSPDDIEESVATRTRDVDCNVAWGQKYVDALRLWQANMKKNVATWPIVRDWVNMPLSALRLGPLTFVTVPGEFFSKFSDLVSRDAGGKVHTIGYANANFGYVCPEEAYAEGGYEVDVAHVFYNTFRARKGSFEMLAREAANLVMKL